MVEKLNTALSLSFFNKKNYMVVCNWNSVGSHILYVITDIAKEIRLRFKTNIQENFEHVNSYLCWGYCHVAFRL